MNKPKEYLVRINKITPIISTISNNDVHHHQHHHYQQENYQTLASSVDQFYFQGPFYRILKYSWLFPLCVAIIIPGLSFVIEFGYFIPQGGVFSQLMDILAILIFMTVVTRSKQVNYYLRFHVRQKHQMISGQSVDLSRRLIYRLHRANMVALVFALVSVLFLGMTGNFAATQYPRYLYLFGSGMSLLSLLLYGGCMVYVSLQLKRAEIETCPATMTFAVTLGAISFVYCIIYNMISLHKLGPRTFDGNHNVVHQDIKNPAYLWHILGVSFKWVTVNSFALMFACLSRRMRRFRQ